MSFTLCRKEIRLWWAPLLEHTSVSDLYFETGEVLALEKVVQVARREDESAVNTLHQ